MSKNTPRFVTLVLKQHGIQVLLPFVVVYTKCITYTESLISMLPLWLL